METKPLRECSSPFTNDVYRRCGEDLGDILSFDYIQANEGDNSFAAHFFSSRVLEKAEADKLERAVKAAAGGLDITAYIRYNAIEPADIRDGVVLKLRREKPIIAVALQQSLWHIADNIITIDIKYVSDTYKTMLLDCSKYIEQAVFDCFGIKKRIAFNFVDYAPVTVDADGDDYIFNNDELPDNALVMPQDYRYNDDTESTVHNEDTAVVTQKTVQSVKTAKKSATKRNSDGIYGRPIKDTPMPIKDITEYSGFVTVDGVVMSVERKNFKNGDGCCLLIAVTDYTSSVICKLITNVTAADEIEPMINDAKRIVVSGRYTADKFGSEYIIMVNSIAKSSTVIKEEDTASVKRVELHLHTRLSEMDSVVNPSELIKLAKAYGHDAVAITDHGVVQAYPDMEAAVAKQKADIKLLFGLEGYLFDDMIPMLDLPAETPIYEPTYVVFDLETTGLDAHSDKIIEIGAVKIKGDSIIDRFSTFVDPQRNIADKIRRLTGINNSLVAGAPIDKDAVADFLRFAKGSVLVAHNADFDTSFIRFVANKYGYEYDFKSLDTLALSRYVLPDRKSYKLDKICEELGVLLVDHHRAVNDAEATACALLKMFSILQDNGIETVGELNAKSGKTTTGETYHIVIFAKDKTGLFNLYKLVTESHLHYFHRRPRIPRSLLVKYREGLILGSACEAGELFRAVVNREKHEKLKEIAEFYDYLEVQPIGNNEFMLRNGTVKSREELQNFNRTIIELGDEMNKLVVATGDVHFLRKRDECFRRIILAGQGYEDADQQAPLYYRTTQEMLDEFSYLPPDKAREIVIDNTRKIADMCVPMESFPRDRLYTPKMDGAEEKIVNMAMSKAHRIYGDPLPEIVEKRLQKELDAIIKHGFAVLYLIAQKVVAKSLSDGYLVGSRGSVGSSFAATMTDITEVNPLPPHYVCKNCKFSDFDVDTEKYGSGYDLPKRKCPNCGAELDRQGFDIPFEVFMGFKGDKAPDIDLNFSGEYQPVIHEYIKELFGTENVFRAGTISGVADKTAYGYVMKYCENHKLHLSEAEKNRLVAGCVDVKRTTGQHPAGMVVLPKEHQIFEFTPLQYPSNDESKGVITTHFDFNSLHDTLLKLDILGHDDPTTIKRLEELTGINAREIPVDDEKVMSLFLSTEALGVTPEELGSPVGTFGVPEFGTKFVRKMLVETKPQTFADLVRISGLSHGTDVWTNNAQDIVNAGIATLPELICTREDIMNKLLHKGVSETIAFKTMETVRKGKPMTEEMENAMVEVQMPQWFIDSCHKIKYMFPKAHAAAYVTMALRIAYFKVYYPQAYYMAYFTVRADDFDINLVSGNVQSLRERIKDYYDMKELNPREKGILTMLEIALEMKLRGIDFTGIDLYKSAALDFMPEGDKLIIPPLNALAGLGENAAKAIVEARKDGPFTSQENLISRAKVSRNVMDVLLNNGCLKGMSQSEQIMLFELD